MQSLSRKIEINNFSSTVDLTNPIVRYPGNPLLTALDVNNAWKDPKLKVITVHNAGITEYQEKVIMLFRSHLRNGISVIGLASSKNGISDWEIEPVPVLKPCNKNDLFAEGVNKEELIENEMGGVEDPRISCIDGTYYITYSAYHGFIKDKVRVSLISTTDFKSFTRHGPLLSSDMRNVVIFPSKFNDNYIALFRPNDQLEGATGGIFKEIKIGYSENLENGSWILSKNPIMKQKGGPSSFSDKIGPGATPILTSHGWLNIFHGVRNTMDGNPYVLGVALHDLKNPEKIKVSNIPVLFPTAADCKVGDTDYVHVPNVVFTCGAISRNDGTVLIYYGGNDTVMNLAFSHQDVLAKLCKEYPQNPLNGQALYKL